MKHPYLHIDKNLELDWAHDEDIKNNGVHPIKYNFKCNLNLETNEIVEKFIRYQRNYYAFYTNFKHTYENTPNGVVFINIKSDIVPTYDQGWYIGYSDNQIHFVNRKTPDECTSIPFETPVKSLFYVKYTNYLIVNTDTCTSKYLTDFESITEETKLCEPFETMCMNDDSAVMALSHIHGKVSIIWTTTWKTHHTLRSPPLITMDINTNKLVGITKNTHNIYVWDLISGTVVINLNSPWNKPQYVYINEDINTFGITTIDNKNKLITSYEISKKKSFIDWPCYEISPTVNIISVAHFPYEIDALIPWNGNILLNGDGYFIKIKYSLNSIVFQWPINTLKWIKNPSEELYLTPLADINGELPEIIIKILIKHMKKIVENLLEAVICGDKICKWSMNKLLKDKKISENFVSAFNYNIIEFYTGNIFEDREIVCNIVKYMRNIHIEVTELGEILPCPEKLSEFIFWISLFKNFPKLENIIISRPSFCKDVYNIFNKSEDEIRVCSAELLNILSPFIGNWKVILEDTSVFEFVQPDIVKKSCKAGYTSDWICCFIKAHQQHYMNNNIKLCWKELIEWVLSPKQLKTFNYPNPNDGIWEQQSINEIIKGAWVLIDDTIQEFELPDEDYSGPETLKCWVRNKEGYANSIERALTLLDKELWKSKKKWQIWDKNMALSTGMEVRTKYGLGTVINWPAAVISTGLMINLSGVEDDLFYRIPNEEYFIPITLRIIAEEFIISLITNDKLPYIPDHSKSVVLDIMSPHIISNITSVDTITDITAIILCYENLWLGTITGDIIVMENERITFREKNVMELLSPHTQAITSFDKNYAHIVSSSTDGVVSIWDNKTLKRLTVYVFHNSTEVEKVVFTSEKIVWILTRNGSLYSWNFILDTIPLLIHKENNLNMALNMSVYNNYVLVGTSKLMLWYNEYPQHINLVKHIQVTTCCIISRDNFLTGSVSGIVNLYTRSDGITTVDTIWSRASETISTLYWISDSLNWCILIGCKSGLLVVKTLNNDKIPFEWNASSGIISITYQKPTIVVLTADYTIYTMTYRDNQIKISSESLCKLVKNNSWKKFIKRPNKTLDIQNIILQGFKNEICIEEFHEIIKICLDNEENTQEWCKKTILTILSIGSLHYRKKYQELMNHLFCFTGKRFKCTLCLGTSSSPKRFPISAINTCMHRFHTKCIEEHCKKTKEWDDECQQNWALHCTLKCPLCNEPFTKKNLVDDRYLTNMCKYISDDENDI